MVSGGPIWCWWLLMVVYGPRLLNFVKHLFYIQTAWASKAKTLTWQKYTSKNHSSFFHWLGGNSLTHIFHIDIYIFVGVEQKFHLIFWRTPYLLFLSLKSNFCISFRPMVPSNINAESARFFWLFLAKYWIKLPHVCFPFSHCHLFCFGGIMYHRLYEVLLWS